MKATIMVFVHPKMTMTVHHHGLSLKEPKCSYTTQTTTNTTRNSNPSSHKPVYQGTGFPTCAQSRSNTVSLSDRNTDSISRADDALYIVLPALFAISPSEIG